MDLVSIITPSYNSASFIEETILSVLTQSYTNWELLITDDCSKDNSVDIINLYAKKDQRIKLFVLEKNSGAAIARNNSISMSKGRYIAFLDSDDIWAPNKLEKQIKYMKNKDIAFSITDYGQMSEDGFVLDRIIKVPEELTYSQYLKNTIIGCLTVIVDRDKVGDFKMPIIRSSQDMATWLLIMRRGFNVYGLNDNLATYRLVATSNSSKKFKAALDVWKVYRNFENLNFIYAVFCFCGYVYNAIRKRL